MNSIFKSIQCGEIQVGIGAGVESMSHHFGPQALAPEVARPKSDILRCADIFFAREAI